MLNQKSNIYQIDGSRLEKYGLLDYIKELYKPIVFKGKNKYLMINTQRIEIKGNNILDSIFIQMIQAAAMAGYTNIMIMV